MPRSLGQIICPLEAAQESWLQNDSFDPTKLLKCFDRRIRQRFIEGHGHTTFGKKDSEIGRISGGLLDVIDVARKNRLAKFDRLIQAPGAVRVKPETHPI